MTNEEIINSLMMPRAIFAGVVVDAKPDLYATKDALYRMLDLARSDEREKMNEELPLRDSPPVGSGPWAIMQFLAGRPIRWSGLDDLGVWKPSYEIPRGYEISHFLCLSGWSVVPDEPKPMTFAEASDHCFAGGTARWNRHGLEGWKLKSIDGALTWVWGNDRKPIGLTKQQRDGVWYAY